MIIDRLTSGLEAQPELFTQRQADLSVMSDNLQETQLPIGVGLDSFNSTLNNQLNSVETQVHLDVSNSSLEHLENKANLPNPQLQQDGRSVANLLNIEQNAPSASLSPFGVVITNDFGNQQMLGMSGGGGIERILSPASSVSRASSISSTNAQLQACHCLAPKPQRNRTLSVFRKLLSPTHRGRSLDEKLNRGDMSVEAMRSNYDLDKMIECLSTCNLSSKELKANSEKKEFFSKIPLEIKKHFRSLNNTEQKKFIDDTIELGTYITSEMILSLNVEDDIKNTLSRINTIANVLTNTKLSDSQKISKLKEKELLLKTIDNKDSLVGLIGHHRILQKYTKEMSKLAGFSKIPTQIDHISNKGPKSVLFVFCRNNTDQNKDIGYSTILPSSANRYKDLIYCTRRPDECTYTEIFLDPAFNFAEYRNANLLRRINNDAFKWILLKDFDLKNAKRIVRSLYEICLVEDNLLTQPWLECLGLKELEKWSVPTYELLNGVVQMHDYFREIQLHIHNYSNFELEDQKEFFEDFKNKIKFLCIFKEGLKLLLIQDGKNTPINNKTVKKIIFYIDSQFKGLEIAYVGLEKKITTTLLIDVAQQLLPPQVKEQLAEVDLLIKEDKFNLIDHLPECFQFVESKYIDCLKQLEETARKLRVDYDIPSKAKK